MCCHLHAIVKQWAFKEEQTAVSSGVIEEKAAVKALISDPHFSMPSFVHTLGFVFCKCSVLLFLNYQDTMSYQHLVSRTLCPIKFF